MSRLQQLAALLLVIFNANHFCFAQNSVDDIIKFQQTLNAEYKNPQGSPLDEKARKRFKQHDFFSIDTTYRVRATLTITENTPFFAMKTSTGALPEYRVFGFINFRIKGENYQLNVYQSKTLMNNKVYADYLFLPFTDLTTGVSSYEGGRYLELLIPKEGNELVVDFNKAYNPYCAYSTKYACPLVPSENNLPIEIKAGVAFKNKKKKV